MNEYILDIMKQLRQSRGQELSGGFLSFYVFKQILRTGIISWRQISEHYADSVVTASAGILEAFSMHISHSFTKFQMESLSKTISV
jgi:hypothetical protein